MIIIALVPLLMILVVRYVAMHAMQEEGSSHNHDSHATPNGYADGTPSSQRKPKGPEIRDTLATVVGMLLPLLTQFGHHH
jgi:zinc transporter 9